jgi:hypothetical protein
MADTSTEKLKVFISYSRKDSVAFADELVLGLEDRGFAPFLDRHDIMYRTGAHPTIQFNQFLIAPYIGVGSPVDQSMFIDNLRLATSRIP